MMRSIQISPVITVIVILSVLVIGIMGCSGCLSGETSPPVTPGPEQAVSFIDSTGTSFTLTVQPRRIVCLNTDAAEVLAAIGAGDRVVGVSESLLTDPAMAGMFPNAVLKEYATRFVEGSDTIENFSPFPLPAGTQVIP